MTHPAIPPEISFRNNFRNPSKDSSRNSFWTFFRNFSQNSQAIPPRTPPEMLMVVPPGSSLGIPHGIFAGFLLGNLPGTPPEFHSFCNPFRESSVETSRTFVPSSGKFYGIFFQKLQKTNTSKSLYIYFNSSRNNLRKSSRSFMKIFLKNFVIKLSREFFQEFHERLLQSF